jgi:hypothetical protein
MLTGEFGVGASHRHGGKDLRSAFLAPVAAVGAVSESHCHAP